MIVFKYGLCGYCTYSRWDKSGEGPAFRATFCKYLQMLFANIIWKTIIFIGPICLKVREAPDSKTTFQKLLKQPSSNHPLTPTHMFREVLNVLMFLKCLKVKVIKAFKTLVRVPHFKRHSVNCCNPLQPPIHTSTMTKKSTRQQRQWQQRQQRQQRQQDKNTTRQQDNEDNEITTTKQ